MHLFIDACERDAVLRAHGTETRSRRPLLQPLTCGRERPSARVTRRDAEGVTQGVAPARFSVFVRGWRTAKSAAREMRSGSCARCELVEGRRIRTRDARASLNGDRDAIEIICSTEIGAKLIGQGWPRVWPLVVLLTPSRPSSPGEDTDGTEPASRDGWRRTARRRSAMAIGVDLGRCHPASATTGTRSRTRAN